MKLLLCSAGVTNPSILAALERLLPRPISECRALLVPTANYANRNGAERAWYFVTGNEPRCPMAELGWASLGLLELTAIPSMGHDHWRTWVSEADVLLVNGGDPLYLVHWLRESGLAELLPTLPDLVYAGLSAGSMALTPRIGEDFVGWKQPDGTDTALGLVGFSIFPHLDNPDLPENTLAAAQQWAAGLGVPAYAIDDQSAIVVDGDDVQVVSAGHWQHFA